ncbi:MAG: hypothetical protein HRU18_01615 [Pseudoalteromonas sp.]|uniref:hypothetical protein n=1 Tax=Pseudoalteromonas sp. TaxID=53249 RepID=UPI001D38471D|nr:hypothetical protein [Pseudoalteromonas sp.]NRA76879.1 hypothetical protein [Pseudoalteromonas sp.]
MKTLNESIKEFELNEAKTVEIPSTAIELSKIAMDANGNKTAYFIRKGKKGKIQTNGNMPKTHSMGLHKSVAQLKKLSDDELKTIGQEIEAYYKEIGEGKIDKKTKTHLVGYLKEIESLLPKAKKEIEDSKLDGDAWTRLSKIILEADKELWYKLLNK